MTEGQISSFQLSDENFLEDYLTFAVWQPAYMAHWLYKQASSAGTAKTCFALQIYLNMEMALEALSKWYFALRDWRPGCEPLLWRFKKTDVREKPEARDHATHIALKDLNNSCADEILSKLKQPSEAHLRDAGWSENELENRSASVDSLLKTFRAGLQNRVAGDGDLVRAYNNLKHGLLALHELPGANQPPSLFLISRVKRGQGGGSLVTPLGLSCESDNLRPLRDTTIATCKLIAVLLNLLPWYFYSRLTWAQYKAEPDNLIGAVTKVSKKIDKLVASS